MNCLLSCPGKYIPPPVACCKHTCSSPFYLCIYHSHLFLRYICTSFTFSLIKHVLFPPRVQFYMVHLHLLYKYYSHLLLCDTCTRSVSIFSMYLLHILTCYITSKHPTTMSSINHLNTLLCCPYTSFAFYPVFYIPSQQPTLLSIYHMLPFYPYNPFLFFLIFYIPSPHPTLFSIYLPHILPFYPYLFFISYPVFHI